MYSFLKRDGSYIIIVSKGTLHHNKYVSKEYTTQPDKQRTMR